MGDRELQTNGSGVWPLKLIGGILSLIVAPIIVALILHRMGVGGAGGTPPEPRPQNPPTGASAAAHDATPPPERGSTHGVKDDKGEPSAKEVAAAFSEVVLDKAFAKYFQANRLLMEVSGVKVIRLTKDRTVVLAVASTPLKDNSAAERLRVEKVCRIKATASLAAEKVGIQVAHVEELKEKTRVVIDNAGEKGQSVSELLQTTRTKVEGLAREMPVVGRWKSKEGDVFYLAIGAVCDKEGNPLPQEVEK